VYLGIPFLLEIGLISSSSTCRLSVQVAKRQFTRKKNQCEHALEAGTQFALSALLAVAR